MKTHKPSSVRSVVTLGSAVYGEAIERRLTTHNPFARLRLPEAASGPKRNLSPSDVHALIDGATDLMRPFVATVAFTGGRVEPKPTRGFEPRTPSLRGTFEATLAVVRSCTP
jgi:hypothetical protein